jgi:hypothetical protein
MTVYDFAFILDANPEDADLADRLAAPPLDDASLILQNGAWALSFDREGDSYRNAVLSAYEDIKAVGVNILSFDPDYLVSATDIAERAGVSKAAVSKYVHQDPSFPGPVRLVMTPRPLYDWVEVCLWFFKRDQVSLEAYQNAIVSRMVNFGAQASRHGAIDLDIGAMIDKKLAAV